MMQNVNPGARQAALDFISRGWAPIPIPYKEKGPLQKNWGDIRVATTSVDKYFSMSPLNLGVILGDASNGLIDIDLDCQEAVTLAPYFLPKTDSIFGRKSKPKSHYLYYVPGIKSKRLQTGEGTVVEIRSNGGQTVFPPSVHPMGETIEWYRDGVPAEVSIEEIEFAVSRLAAACLLARHWPAEGSRHDTALALSGALLQANWDQEQVEHFVDLVATYGRSKKVPAKIKTVATTIKRLEQNLPVTGLLTLQGLIPEQIVKKVAEWLSLKSGSHRSRITGHPLCTDAANADRLVKKFGNQIAWIEDAGVWAAYTGTHWAFDKELLLQKFAIDVARDIPQEANAANDLVAKKQLAKWAADSQNKQRIEAMIKMARHLVSYRAEDFDIDPLRLNVANGVVNLRTGELEPHQAANRVTKLIPITYDPNAKCPRWRAFLQRVFDNDADVVRFIQLAIGYSMTGSMAEQCLFILHGEGNNGKSVLLKVLGLLLGEYGRPTEMRALMHKGSNVNLVRNDIAGLRGCRYVTASEIPPGARFDEALLKQLTGGDKITARLLFKEYLDFYPTFKIWLAVNHLPLIHGDEEAIWRRIRVIPFTVTIPEVERIPNLAELLIKEEGAGILAWAIEGCLQWQQVGLEIPMAIQAATTTYRTTNDPISEFLNDRCVFGAELGPRANEAMFPCGDLYNQYRIWCDESAAEPVSLTVFGKAMRKRFPSKQKWGDGRNRRHYMGICVKDDPRSIYPPKGNELVFHEIEPEVDFSFGTEAF